MSEAWFEFNGIKSTDMGIRLRQMPTRFLPGRNVTRETVSGRSGTLALWDGSYKDVQVRIECDARDPAKFNQIWGWLAGSGLLRFSDEPGLAYEASVDKEYSRAPIYPRTTSQRFVVIWTCAPYRRMYPEPKPVEIRIDDPRRPTPWYDLRNPGTAPSLPRVEIAGRGSFSVTIGKQTIFFSGVEDGIIVDSELMDALTLDGSQLANDKMDGDFFEIQPGENAVQWIEGGEDDEGAAASGSIERITISPRWRYM